MKNILIFVALILTRSLCGQVPQGINYQTVVRNSAGNIIANQAVGMKFLLHQGSATGTVAYAETQTTTTNQFGLITLVIGQGTPVTGTFGSVIWSTGIVYLETRIDPTGGTNYQVVGTPQQLMSVPYALYADSAVERQTLSISGNQLSISSGNTVTLPNGSSSGSAVCYQQTLQQGQYYSFVTATSEPNVDSFVAVFGYYPGNNVNYAYANMVRHDDAAGSYEIAGASVYVTQCGGGNAVYITNATTHQGGIYFTYTNGCGTNVVETSSGPVTFNVQPTNSNGIIFSDGQYMYVNNNTNWLKYSVSGSAFTLSGSPLSFSNAPGGIKSIMCDGTNIFVLTSGILYKYNLSWSLVSQKNVYGAPTGMVNIDATRLYLLSATLVPSSTSDIGSVVMTPISKP